MKTRRFVKILEFTGGEGADTMERAVNDSIYLLEKEPGVKIDHIYTKWLYSPKGELQTFVSLHGRRPVRLGMSEATS